MKRNIDETTVEINMRRYANMNLDQYMKHEIEPTPTQRASWNMANRMPSQRAGVYRADWGQTKVRSFTLTERTYLWLDHLPRGTRSKVVEIALCRYRMWKPMRDYIVELTAELVEARKQLKALQPKEEMSEIAKQNQILKEMSE